MSREVRYLAPCDLTPLTFSRLLATFIWADSQFFSKIFEKSPIKHLTTHINDTFK